MDCLKELNFDFTEIDKVLKIDFKALDEMLKIDFENLPLEEQCRGFYDIYKRVLIDNQRC